MIVESTIENLRLETPRLLLRPPRIEDLDPWAAMMGDPETARFIGGTLSRAVTWRGLMIMIGAWHAQGFAMFSVIEKAGPGQLPPPYEHDAVIIWGQTREEWRAHRSGVAAPWQPAP